MEDSLVFPGRISCIRLLIEEVILLLFALALALTHVLPGLSRVIYRWVQVKGVVESSFFASLSFRHLSHYQSSRTH